MAEKGAEFIIPAYYGFSQPASLLFPGGACRVAAGMPDFFHLIRLHSGKKQKIAARFPFSFRSFALSFHKIRLHSGKKK